MEHLVELITHHDAVLQHVGSALLLAHVSEAVAQEVLKLTLVAEQIAEQVILRLVVLQNLISLIHLLVPPYFTFKDVVTFAVTQAL